MQSTDGALVGILDFFIGLLVLLLVFLMVGGLVVGILDYGGYS